MDNNKTDLEVVHSKKSPSHTRGTLQHFKLYRWKELNKRTINGSQSKRLHRKGNASYLKKQIELRLTKQEFYDFCDKNAELIKLLYSENKTPSIDRINSNGHYELTNIRIIDIKHNRPQKVIKSKIV